MEQEDKIKDIENRFMVLAKADGLDEAVYWLAGAFNQSAIDGVANCLVTGFTSFIDDLFIAKAKEVHGD